MKRAFFFPVLISICTSSWGQFSLATTTYTQDFNGLANTGSSSVLPAGWRLSESGSSANSTYTAGTGSASAGDTYSFGPLSPSSERALGTLRSGTLIPVFGFYLTNNTGSTIISISINYTGETWRVGAANRQDRLDFQYSLNATSLTTGSWTDHDFLDYSNPGQPTGNGSLQHSTNIASLITGLGIANGATLFIRWVDTDATGSDDGMGIDDLTLNAVLGIPTPVNLINFTGRKEGPANLLRWVTASESNNYGFEIERSGDGIHYSDIGFVYSKAIGGNSAVALNYSFTDHDPVSRNYYRLRQLDLDSNSRVSNIILIGGDKPLGVTISRLFPNPGRHTIKLIITGDDREKIILVITDIFGRVLRQTSAVIDPGLTTIDIDISNFSNGNYYVKFFSEEGGEMIVRGFVKE